MQYESLFEKLRLHRGSAVVNEKWTLKFRTTLCEVDDVWSYLH